MKRSFLLIISIIMTISASAQFNLGDLLGGLGNKDSESESGGLAGALSGIVGGLLSTDKLSLDQLVGTWSYNEPAVCFKSDNLLQKAGGAAVAETIEEKLAPYYRVTGLDKVQLTVYEDTTFVMKFRASQLKGVLEFVDEGQSNIVFHFQALKKINLGSMHAYVVCGAGGKSLDLMFDVTKLIDIVDKVSVIAKSSAITSTVSLLKSYDGLCVGFTLAHAE